MTLSKESTESEIKTYFQKVLELKQSNEDFPVSLDDVWPLVYADKGKAVRALKGNFIEDVDFVSFTQNGKRETGATQTTNYKLSVSCMEYFIARKVRSVFEVYRQVFHKAAEQKPLSPAETLLKQVQLMVEQEKRIDAVETKVLEIEARTRTRPDYFTVVGYATLHNISVNLKQATSVGRKASVICKQRNFQTGDCPDPRFGRVKTYPAAVLDEAFEMPIN